MFIFDLLNVGIGVIFLFLLLSLICSAFTEIIELFLKRRAAELYQGIHELLGEEKTSINTQTFYEHPLVRVLYKGSFKAAKQAKALPSYIPSRNFALALMDMILPSSTNQLSGAANAVAPQPQPKPTPQAAVTPSDPPIATTTGAMQQAQPQPDPQPLQLLRSAVLNSDNQHVRGALLPLIDAAGNDVNRARENIEAWYDSAMDRVSGWYKRGTQWILLIVGFIVAIAFNADTIAVARSLANDAPLRESVVAVAQTYASMEPPPPQSEPAPDPESPFLACRRDTNLPACRVEQNLAQVQKLGLPLGWDFNDSRSIPSFTTANGILAWILKPIGWSMTALAITLGAPFWFDLLNKFLVIRSTVKPKEKSPEEESED